MTKERNSMGVLYIARNETHSLDRYKVGFTSRLDIDERMKELTQLTGNLGVFECKILYIVKNARLREGQVHDALARYRVQENREFFDAPLSIIDQAILQIIPPEELIFRDGEVTSCEELTKILRRLQSRETKALKMAKALQEKAQRAFSESLLPLLSLMNSPETPPLPKKLQETHAEWVRRRNSEVQREKKLRELERLRDESASSMVKLEEIGHQASELYVLYEDVAKEILLVNRSLQFAGCGACRSSVAKLKNDSKANDAKIRLLQTRMGGASPLPPEPIVRLAHQEHVRLDGLDIYYRIHQDSLNTEIVVLKEKNCALESLINQKQSKAEQKKTRKRPVKRTPG